MAERILFGVDIDGEERALCDCIPALKLKTRRKTIPISIIPARAIMPLCNSDSAKGRR